METAYALEDRVGVQLGPIVVNGVDLGEALPDPDRAQQAVADVDADVATVLLDAARFRSSRRAMEEREVARLTAELPLPQLLLPARPVAGLGPADIDELAANLTDASS
jgi:hypothetical protein